MKIDILTLFPEMFEGFINTSIIKRAIEKEKVTINLINFRDYSPLNNKQVDDTPYGGGSGMILRCEPIFECLDSLDTSDAYIILLSPEGTKYKQSVAKRLLEHKHLIIICGHYEGYDERIKTRVDEVISIGDYILTGGEIPAMAITDSITRLIPGVITNKSLLDESFNDSLLDYPTYTKPAEYRGLKVPDVLTSGNHQKINEYRATSRIEKTKALRPDLMEDNND
ncbi:tRNA (guanine-N(1)-)-methyltransferase [Firmicutes bacterium CAG:460]|nr:tRNA (guanine-N(1)-)-methyltransferase [Firmicutes bacterium CAG:460]